MEVSIHFPILQLQGLAKFWECLIIFDILATCDLLKNEDFWVTEKF